MAVHSYRLVTEEEYLKHERQAQTKSEYVRGEIFALAGDSASHNTITVNLVASLHTQLRGTGCRVWVNDMRVRVVEAGAYFYPDVVVVCGQPQFLDEHQDTLLNPMLIVEVLSPSTEAFDRGEKSFYYRRLSSLREYLLVSQDRVRIERYVRQANGEWLLHDYTEPGQIVRLESLGVEMPVAQIYEGIDFADLR
ncbi:MAG: Uma2 family endonuclease [Chthonomonadetes bacterium]|jgi:Uma2 family endonuclease|nr:Uma2 family endonuclease [Chthonomonadetes bacterium]